MTTDEALYIDDLDEKEQPGLHVRKFNDLDGITDEDVIERYTDGVVDFIINKLI